MKNLVISPKILAKLETRHGVSQREVVQCFYNQLRTTITDTREEHESDPPTEWFIAETDRLRRLCIVFVNRNGNIYLRTAFDPNADREALYAAESQSL